MAGINYATKYSSVVDDKFALSSLTNGLGNNEYDWVGVQTVAVYSIPDVSLVDYDMTKADRYGTATELEDEVQEMQISQDKSFTFTIDRANYDDTMMTKEAGKRLAVMLSNVVIPYVDTYRIAQMVENAGNTYEATVTSSNAYDSFLEVQAMLDDDKVPQGNRVCICTAQFYKKIKEDDSFIKQSDLGQTVAFNGQVGEIDGVPVIKAPTSYFPQGAEFIIVNPLATVNPVKLQDYKIHDNPVGISGYKVEFRVRFDSFVLNNKADAVGVCVAP